MMDKELLVRLFQSLGANEEQANTSVNQLFKRAKQLAQESNITEQDALENLVKKIVGDK